MIDFKSEITSPEHKDLLVAQVSPLKRLVIGLVLITAVVGALGIYQLFHSYRQDLQQAETNSRMLAGTLQQTISAMLQKTDLNLRHVVDETLHQTATGGIQKELLAGFVEKQFKLMPELDSLSISDAGGMLVLGSGKGHAEPVSIADREYFIHLRDHPGSGMVISKPNTCKISNKWVITIARRITLADGAFAGIAYAELSLRQFTDLFRTIPVGPHGTISFRRDDLTLLSRYSEKDNQINDNITGTALVPAEWQKLLDQGNTENGQYTAANPITGIERIHAYRRVTPYGLYINVGLALDDILQDTRKNQLVAASLFGLFLCMSITLVWQIHRNWQKGFAAEQELKRNYKRLELMQEVSQYQADNVQELLDFALDKVVALTDSSIGYIYHYNEEDHLFVLNSWSKDVMAACMVVEPQTVYHLERTGLWGEAVRQRRPIMVNDYQAESELKKGYPDGHVHLSSFLTVPVFDKDRIVAVVGVANKATPYDQTDQIQLMLMMEGLWKIVSKLKLEEYLREMQTQLLQNDKLATIGQLAAGVAHEINNPMGFIGSNLVTLGKYIEKYESYIGLLERQIRTGSPGELPEQVQAMRRSLKLDYVMNDISILLDECGEGIDRVNRIVQDLRTFSHADTSSMVAADLNKCIESTINLVINELKYAAELKREYGDLAKITCNVQQINQVLMNLLINAVHAIQVKGEEVGEIVIRTWCDNKNAFVSVSDNGCGIPPENCAKIFDAFYTTKEVGKGTGLGLSISSGIIRKHGGEIMVSSEVGQGTVFTVRLPADSSKVEEHI